MTIDEIENLIEEHLLNYEGFSIGYTQTLREDRKKELEEATNIPSIYCSIIASYVGLGFQRLNFKLRGSHYGLMDKQTEIYANIMNLSLDKFPPVNNQIVTRNENSYAKEEILNWYKENVGKVIKVPSFWSVSQLIQPSTTMFSEPVMYKIKTLTEGTSCRSIIKLTEIIEPGKTTYEKEAIFKIDSMFRIDRVEDVWVSLTETSDVTNDLLLGNGYWEN